MLLWHGEDSEGKGQRVSVSFPNAVVVEGVWNGTVLLGEDGFYRPEVTMIVNGKEPPPSEASWSRTFCRIASGKEETRGVAAFLVIGTIAYVLGVLGFCFQIRCIFS